MSSMTRDVLKKLDGSSGDLLDQIIRQKRGYITERRAIRPQGMLERQAKSSSLPRGFKQALVNTSHRYAIITEIKRGSPSKGLIRADFSPKYLAEDYAKGGATCLSVLTDKEFFGGDDVDLIEARSSVDLPVLRKDFIIDVYQVWESRVIGADCILLIMAALSDTQALEMAQLALSLNLDVLVEVHDERELARAMALPEAVMLGINNRNLKTLQVDLGTTLRLAPQIPRTRVVVSESGFAMAGDLAKVSAVWPCAFLIGESLMRQTDIAAATRALLL